MPVMTERYAGAAGSDPRLTPKAPAAKKAQTEAENVVLALRGRAVVI